MDPTGLGPRIDHLCERFQVKRLAVFGSRARNDASPGSDFDFLVRFKDLPPADYSRNYFGLLHALEDTLGARVDLITEPSITRKTLEHTIEHEKLPLYPS